jgi:hypothetical protein
MKQTMLLTLMVLISATALSQNRRYTKAMTRAGDQLIAASTPVEHLDVADTYDKIAEKHKDQWLAPYYVAYALTIGSLEETDAGTSDSWLERATESMQKAKALNPEESEVIVLEAWILLAKMAVDPETRGPAYIEEFSWALEKAKGLNPENPRCYYLEGLLTLNMPDFMGGGPAAAKPIFQQADDKFKSFQHEDPLWPRWGESMNSEELAKL